jgi:hypothetical protein
MRNPCFRANCTKHTAEILLPPVVGGKILETWELWRLLVGRGSVSEPGTKGALVELSGLAVQKPRPLSGCQRSKIILQIISAFLCYRE